MRADIFLLPSLWFTLPTALLAASEAPSAAPTIELQLLAKTSTPSPISVVSDSSQAIRFAGQTFAPTSAQTQDIQFKALAPFTPTMTPSRGTRLPATMAITTAPTLVQTQSVQFQNPTMSSNATTKVSTSAPSQAPLFQPSISHAGIATGVPTAGAFFQADSGMPSLATSFFAPSSPTSAPTRTVQTGASSSLTPTQLATAAAGLTSSSPSHSSAAMSSTRSPSPQSVQKGGQSTVPAHSSSNALNSPTPSVTAGAAHTRVPTHAVHISGNNTKSAANSSPSLVPSSVAPASVLRSEAPSAVPSLRVTASGAQSASGNASDAPSFSPSDQPSLGPSIHQSDVPSLVPSTLPSGLRARSTLSPAPVNPYISPTVTQRNSGGLSPSATSIMLLLTTWATIVMTLL